MTDVRIATRRSALALWQANTVARLLGEQGYATELVPLVTSGDKLQKGALADVTITAEEAHLRTGKGLFVKEIQEAMLGGQANLAVHSMKDLPVTQTRGLVTAALLPRAPIEDVLVLSPGLRDEVLDALDAQERARIEASVEGLHLLPYARLRGVLSGLRGMYRAPLGTTSARRQALLRREFGEDLKVEVLRGNVDTRLSRVARGEFPAIMLARAGLVRLGLYEGCNMYPLPADVFIPAPAQGVIALECPERELAVREALARVADIDSVVAAALERLALWMLGGDCHTAIGASWQDPTLHVFCSTATEMREASFEVEPRLREDLAGLVERERGFFHGFFESLKTTNLARSLYSALRSAEFSTLIPWNA